MTECYGLPLLRSPLWRLCERPVGGCTPCKGHSLQKRLGPAGLVVMEAEERVFGC